jgi:hypothetical protein
MRSFDAWVVAADMALFVAAGEGIAGWLLLPEFGSSAQAPPIRGLDGENCRHRQLPRRCAK